MRTRVLRWTHIPVCVGIASTKTCAKLANHVAKKPPRLEGVFKLERPTTQQQSNLLGKIDVGDVWGGGYRIKAQLARLGITTARDLRDADSEMIRERFSVGLARTVVELQGGSGRGHASEKADRVLPLLRGADHPLLGFTRSRRQSC